MELDFTFKKYEKLCAALKICPYNIITVKDYLMGRKETPFLIMRHDVERQFANALKMAEIENIFGIKSTYYFRFFNKQNIFRTIKAIKELGHEVGYHYEVLDRAKGDSQKAEKIFAEELKSLRKICGIDTISMHGNPLTKWDNRDIWRSYDFKNYGILGEAYLSVNFNEVVYLTDTGRNWHRTKYNVKDFPLQKDALAFSPAIKNVNDFIFRVKKGFGQNIYMNTHPNLWSLDIFEWSYKLISQNIKNIAKVIIWSVYARPR